MDMNKNGNRLVYSKDIKYYISVELMEFMNIFNNKKVSEKEIIMYVFNYIKFYNLLRGGDKVYIDNKLSKIINHNEEHIGYVDLFCKVASHIVSNSNIY